MDICIEKLSKDNHRVSVCRLDGSEDMISLNSRSFLRHDFAHFAVESEVPIKMGYWGSVAAGAPLSGEGLNLEDEDLSLAEKLAGPVQTLIRLEAKPVKYLEVLQQLQPQLANMELAERIYECARRLAGHWRATPFGETMQIVWKELS